MTGAVGPGPDARLERGYRRLMLAYPRAYRRRHGTEIVTTLLDMAEPGRRRPAAGDAWHLFASGLRQRFRLPAGRPLAVLAAVSVTLITGAFGAAAGSGAAELTFADVPSEAAFAPIFTDVSGPAEGITETRYASPRWGTRVSGSAEVLGWTAETARLRLTAAGWQLSPTEVRTGYLDVASFRATRDGLAMDVTGVVHGSRTYAHATVHASDNGALRPLIVLGGVLGLLVGWPVAAAAAYRRRRLPTARARVAAVSSGLAVSALVVPATAFYGNVVGVFRGSGRLDATETVHRALNASAADYGITHYYPLGPPWLKVALTIAGALFAVTAGTLLVLSRPAPLTTATTPVNGYSA